MGEHLGTPPANGAAAFSDALLQACDFLLPARQYDRRCHLPDRAVQSHGDVVIQVVLDEPFGVQLRERRPRSHSFAFE
jgi:hypothetical protein